MVVVQASKLNLPNSSISFPQINSFLFEPQSLSLALMHSDSSISLYPSISPLSVSSLPSSYTLVPSPSSSSTFVLLQNPSHNCPDPNSRVLFVVSSPYRAGSQVLLRLYILQSQKNLFTRAQVVCNQKDLKFDQKLGVVFDVSHGGSVKLVGSSNFFAMQSVSCSKVWVFAVKLVGDNDNADGVIVKLMRCAVIECCKPVWSISMSFGFLIFGEDNGVRVFNFRQLLKGRSRKVKSSTLNLKLEDQKLCLPNGLTGADVQSGKCIVEKRTSLVTCNGYFDRKNNGRYASTKQKAVKLRQDSCGGGVYFVAFRSKEVEELKKKVVTTLKAVSIQALSPKKYLILDSAGNLHLLRLSTSLLGSDATCHIQHLPDIMKAQKLAVLSDCSSRAQTVWVSDGCYSVHMMTALLDDETVGNLNDGNECLEKPIEISVTQAIFSSEKVQDLIAFSANGLLILGQVPSQEFYCKVILDEFWFLEACSRSQNL